MTGSLYIHVPFCKKRCPYCHFYVTTALSRQKKTYLKALKQEIDQNSEFFNKYPLESIYFGGGTPSQLTPDEIGEILSWIPHDPSIEITLEANPEDPAHYPGVNRLSFGLQSLHNPTLKILGRSHTAQQAIAAINASKVENISIDLMYELPNQTLESWEQTLIGLRHLPITHLSLYNLTIEPNTPFYRKRDELVLPSNEVGAEMLEMAMEHFDKLGLKRYEISAFAKPGYESIHNSGYWSWRPFLGVGPSAFSFIDGRRFRNPCSLKKWAEALKPDFEEKLPEDEAMRERVAIGLRRLEGISLELVPSAIMEDLQRLEKRGFLTLTKRAQLTELGLLHYDTVGQEIIA
ncbi:MAG: radical SAM family heme chaperone HemW [Simkaniaceae bacterium]|nr:radical SAM family heme chaperone HemW [Simkaniaceae bacterium]